MKPWKSLRDFPAYAGLPKLQWGHGDEAVEEIAAGGSVTGATVLQWGHGDEAVEEPADTRSSFLAFFASMGPRR